MSFLGCIGYTMEGSGLSDALATIYAKNSIDKMMTGHAFARAIRGHFLVQSTLSKILFQDMKIEEKDYFEVESCLKNFVEKTPTEDELNQMESLKHILQELDDVLKKTVTQGPTAQLWIQYFRMVTIVKNYIMAERNGNWFLHLECVRNMLPYFHACGHFNYAKSAHLYLQDMTSLRKYLSDEEYKLFVENEFFTIRRTDKRWAGLWSDLIIEQTLMRSMKATGGLTRGRGMSESVENRWISAMPTSAALCDALEAYTGAKVIFTEQHVDQRASRIKLDNKDVEKLVNWFTLHPPFEQEEKIKSISTGLLGAKNVNCFNSYEVGSKAMKATIGQNFVDVHYKRKERVQTLANTTSSININGDNIAIDPLLLFQRISILKKSDEELEEFLKYELAPYPMSLFKNNGFRKTDKSMVIQLFKKEDELIDIKKDFICVVDGGYLLRRVVWGETINNYGQVCEVYIQYVQRHYGFDSVVVFDGYDDENSTKGVERERRGSGMSARIKLNKETILSLNQDKFLRNTENKIALINLLSKEFQRQKMEVFQASDDADTLIVNTAIEKSKNTTKPVVVIGQDVDLLCLLVALTPPEKNISFYRPSMGRRGVEVYESQSHSHLQDNILFLHAFSGCDTTSTLPRMGKKKCFNLLRKRNELQEIVTIFNNCDSSIDAVKSATIRFLLAYYSAPQNVTNLNHWRFRLFMKSSAKNKDNFLSLPPTEDAAHQHGLRVYHQIQLWKNNHLDATEYGWRKENGRLHPITMTSPPAPDCLLKTIYCNCKKLCGNACTCRKHGMKCSKICGSCYGVECTNSGEIEVEADSEEDSADSNSSAEDEDEN